MGPGIIRTMDTWSYRTGSSMASVVFSSRIALTALPRSGMMERPTVSLTDLPVTLHVHLEQPVGDTLMKGRTTD